MPEVQKGILKIAGYSVDEGEWTSRINVWGNEAILRSRTSLPLSLNQIVDVTYEIGGNAYTLVQNGLINKIEIREEGFEKYYEYTVWGREWVGRYRVSSELGSIEPATVKLQRYMVAVGLTPTFYNLSGVTLAPNEIPNQYISDIVDRICRSATTISGGLSYPATINYYFKPDGNPVFFLGTLATQTLNVPLTLRERTEDLSNVHNQVMVYTNYHPINENFDLLTDTLNPNIGQPGNWAVRRKKIKANFLDSEWENWTNLQTDSNTRLAGSISLRTPELRVRVQTITRPFTFDRCDFGAFVGHPMTINVVASSLTGFFICIGTSLSPNSPQGLTSVPLAIRVLIGPDPMDDPGSDKRYLSTEIHAFATTVLTWHTINLGIHSFFRNKIKEEELSKTTLSFLHFHIESSTVWMSQFPHTPESLFFWFDSGYLTEYASTIVSDIVSINNYGLRELIPEEIGSEPKSAKSYNDLVTKGKSLLTPNPERFYSRVEIPATIGLLTLGNAYTLTYSGTMVTGMLNEMQLEIREDEAPKWILTFSSSPEYPARTKLYKKLERIDTAVRYLVNLPTTETLSSAGKIVPYLIAGYSNIETGFLNAGFVQNFEASLVSYIGTIGTIGNIGSLNADYIGQIGSIGNVGNANFQNIGNINQIGTIGNISTMNVSRIGSIEVINTIGQANFGYVWNISQIGTIGNISSMNVERVGNIGLINSIGQANFGYVSNIGSIGYIGSIDRMSVNKIDNINSISNINYAAIVQANITNLGALQNLQTAYLNVTNMATLVSATITNAYVTNISNVNTLNANNLYVSNIGSINTAYLTNANIANISSLSSATIGTAYISVIQNVSTLNTSLANITNIQNVVSLTATTMNATNLFVSGIATIGQIQNVAIINAGSLSVSTISNVVSLVANTVTINQVEKVGKIVALQTQIQLGEGAQNVYIPVPSTVYNFYGMPGATLDFDVGTIDTFLVGTISANSINFRIGTVQTFYIGSASADVMKFKIGTVDNINISVAATGASLGFSAGSIGNITISSIATIYNLNVTNVGTINQLNATGFGHIGTFDLDVGTIDSAWITLGTINYATITATSVGTAYISISTIDSCTIKFGTINSLYAITENVSTLSITSFGSISYATISAAEIGGLYVSAGTLASCTITSGQIGNLSITSSTITQLEITTPLIGKGVIRADNLTFLPYNWIPNYSFEFVDANGNLVDWTGSIVRVTPGLGGVGYAGAVASGAFAWANATIKTDPGEIWRYSGYVKCQSTTYFLLKLLDSNKNPISTITYSLPASSDFTYKVAQIQITAPNAVWIVPGLRTTTYSGTFDELSLTKDVGSINIGNGQVTTDHIRFNTLISDPTYEAGKMWYRSDLDELRFASGTTYDKVTQIPKVPLGAPMRQLFWLRSSWLPAGSETIDVTLSGYTDWRTDVLLLGTGTTSGSTCKLSKKWLSGFSWDKRRIVSVLFWTYSVANTRLRIWSGFQYQASGYPSFGVYFANNSSSNTVGLIGFSWNGTSLSTISLGSITFQEDYLLTMELIPNQALKFYIDGTPIGTITTNLPSGTTNAHGALSVEVYNYTAEDKLVGIMQVSCVQEL